VRRWLLKKVHISWLIAAASFGIIIGCALCAFISPASFADSAWLVVAVALFGVCCVRRLRILLMIALVAGIMTGLYRGSVTKQAFLAYKLYYGKNVVLQGKISEDASYGAHGDQRLRLGDIITNNQSLKGNVWISLEAPADIKRGDNVILKGLLNEGFGNLQATMFRAQVQQINRPHPGDVGRQFRDWFSSGIARAVPAPEVSLGEGYLTGQKNALPDTLQQQIRIAGLTHVVVASGYNLVILVIFARAIFRRVSKYLAALAGGSMIVGFMLITGLSPSMSRAGLVAGLGLLTWYYGRKVHPLVLLSFAAAVTLLLQPSYIWGDVGWYLSFSAFAGVIMLAPLLHHYFWGAAKRPGMLRELIVTTVSAQVMTLPIIVFTFGQYSLYGLLANILVLPVVPFAMLATFVAGLGGLLVPALAGVFGLPATVLLKYCIIVIEKIANLPGAQGDITFTIGPLVFCYSLIIAGVVWLWHQTKHNFRASVLNSQANLLKE
jgi:competence protein ComEC